MGVYAQTLSKLLLALVTVMLLLAACSPGTTATPTAATAPSPTPAPPPIQAAGWEGATVHTLCLELDQSYPGIETDTHIREATAETTERILAGLGLGVVAEGASCEATLAISATGEGLGAPYSAEALFPGDSGDALGPGFTSGYCYTGAEVRGEVTLSAVGRDTLTLSVEARHDPPDVIHGCPGIPEGAPFEEVWVDAMLSPDGVVRQLWGVPGLVRALGDEDAVVRYTAALALGYVGPEAMEAIPALIEALGDEDAFVREAAAWGLRQIGPEAMEAVPALIELLGDEESSLREAASLALWAITGQDLGEDAEVWRDWWEAQQ